MRLRSFCGSDIKSVVCCHNIQCISVAKLDGLCRNVPIVVGPGVRRRSPKAQSEAENAGDGLLGTRIRETRTPYTVL